MLRNTGLKEADDWACFIQLTSGKKNTVFPAKHTQQTTTETSTVNNGDLPQNYAQLEQDDVQPSSPHANACPTCGPQAVFAFFFGMMVYPKTATTTNN